jgi:hypothetical protein
MSDFEIDPDLPDQLEAVAHMAAVSGLHVEGLRVMPAAGVADILYEALHEILLHRQEEDRDGLDRAVEILKRIAKYDHQGPSQLLLRAPPTGAVQRMAAYADQLKAVAQTDIQSWAQEALRHLTEAENNNEPD